MDDCAVGSPGVLTLSITVSSAATARTSLGLGGLAVLNAGAAVADSTVVAAAGYVQATFRALLTKPQRLLNSLRARNYCDVMKFYTINPNLYATGSYWASRGNGRNVANCGCTATRAAKMTLPEYLDAGKLERKISGYKDGECLLTVGIDAGTDLRFTSPRRKPFFHVLTALLAIRRELFEDLARNAHPDILERVWRLTKTKPRNGGMVRMTRPGNDGTTKRRTMDAGSLARIRNHTRAILWAVENNQHERLRILSETDVARTARLSGVATGA